MGGVFNTVNANLYHYAGNNPVKYTDPDGRELGYFDCNKFIKNLIISETHGFMAGCQDAFGRFMNGLQSMFTTKPKVVPFGDASFSIGNFSITGKASYENGKIIFSGTTSGNISLVQLDNVGVISVSLDTESFGLSGDVSIPTQYFIDIKLNGGMQVYKDGTIKITMKTGIGKSIKTTDARVSVGATLKLGWDTQNGNFGTAENKKNESLNQNVRIHNCAKSFEAIESCLR